MPGAVMSAPYMISAAHNHSVLRGYYLHLVRKWTEKGNFLPKNVGLVSGRDRLCLDPGPCELKARLFP